MRTNMDRILEPMIATGSRILADLGENPEHPRRLHAAIAELGNSQTLLAVHVLRLLAIWETDRPRHGLPSCRNRALAEDLRRMLLKAGTDVPSGVPAQILRLIDDGILLSTLKEPDPRLHKAQARVTVGCTALSAHPGALMLLVCLLTCSFVDYSTRNLHKDHPPGCDR